MYTVLIFLVAILLLVIAGFGIFRPVNSANGTIVSAGERRSYILYVPASYAASQPVALVITIHGFAQWPAHQMRISHWNDLADEFGFIIVYPSGTRFPKRWRTRGMPGSELDPAKDLTFFSDLIDKIQAAYNVDPNRIYANGLSNGGGMAFLLACELSDRIAAVGAVAGAFPVSWEQCRPSRAVPIMIFHGTKDPIVPFLGGRYRGRDAFPPIAEWVEILARRYGYTGPPVELPANGVVKGIQYTGGMADIVFYTITDGGHTWPGGEPLPVWITGHTTTAIDATRTLWEFFQAHPLSKREADS